MNRRDFMTTSAALATASLLPNSVSAKTTMKTPTKTAAQTPVTYLQPNLQQQFKQNAQALQSKSYRQFFSGELNVPVEMVNALNQGPLPADKMFTPTVENLNNALVNLDKFPVCGYGAIDDGEKGLTAFTLARHVMPNANTEMFKWWMTWHTVEKERYMLWFPHAHIDNSLQDPKRAADKSLSYEERFYHNPNHIKEYIGETLLDAMAVFVPPEQIGFKPEVLKAQRIEASASGWSHPVGADNMATASLIHLCRNIEGGMEMISFYWTTPHVELGRIAQIEGAGERAVQAAKAQGLTYQQALGTAYEMAVHDMTEFTHLGGILPELYRAFGDK